jgi:nitroreductase
MDFSELAAKRISVRGYLPDPVPEEALAGILEAARMAPSAANRQPWHIVVLRDEAARHAVHAAYPRDWFLQAPVILAVCIEPAVAWTRAEDGWNAAETDGAILMAHLTLAAADLGLGTCWIAAFSPAKLREALALPDGVIPYALTPLGHPGDGGRPKQRRPQGEVVHDGKW